MTFATLVRLQLDRIVPDGFIHGTKKAAVAQPIQEADLLLTLSVPQVTVEQPKHLWKVNLVTEEEQRPGKEAEW